MGARQHGEGPCIDLWDTREYLLTSEISTNGTQRALRNVWVNFRCGFPPSLCIPLGDATTGRARRCAKVWRGCGCAISARAAQVIREEEQIRWLRWAWMIRSLKNIAHREAPSSREGHITAK